MEFDEDVAEDTGHVDEATNGVAAFMAFRETARVGAAGEDV